MSYHDLLARKRRVQMDGGLTVEAASLPGTLYPWQNAIVRWALRKGRACIFADCGLGKTFMQVAWASAIQAPTIILAPLCVAEQTVDEAARLGVHVTYAHDEHEANPAGITITNYERLHKFDVARYRAVVLDESSILKAFDGKTRTALISAFRQTPYRLCCTATPSPNDIAELANHSEFLGLMTRPEFLATWFVHDDAGWRMKRHAVKPFFRWVASWAVALRKPSDLGWNDEGFRLPPLHILERVVDADALPGVLFPGMAARGVNGRIRVRRASLEHRVNATADIVRKAADEQWILWCGLNEESAALASTIPGAVEVKGADSHAEKVGAVRAFVAGTIRVLVTKPKILGFGMNFQNCARMAFVGMSDSYESYYQCIRRAWRFGQQKPVEAWIVVSEGESVVVNNVRKKEEHASLLSRYLLEHLGEFEREEVVA